MEDSVKFGELAHDEDFKSRVLAFERDLGQVEKMVKDFCDLDIYDKLTNVEKIRYELFKAYTLSSLYWFYLRLNGIDPNQHEIRTELNRIRDLMIKSKKLYEKQTLMPKINQDAAKRFIRNSLWTPNQSSSVSQEKREEEAQSRKRKRESDDDKDDEVNNDNDGGGVNVKIENSAK